MKFIKGFSWKIPTAFVHALASCRFEIGDTLYDSEAAYRVWDPAKITRCIQVTYPPRMNITLNKDEKNIFERNWKSEVHVDLIEVNKGMKRERIITTQGRLFSLLATGDIRILIDKRTAPELPVEFKDFKKMLAEDDQLLLYAGKISSQHNTLIHRREKVIQLCKKKVERKLRHAGIFIMPVDHINKNVMGKYAQLVNALGRQFQYVEHEISPRECGWKNYGTFFPTHCFTCIAVEAGNTERLRDILKEVFWATAQTGETFPMGDVLLDKKRTLRVFKLRRHGVFITSQERPKTDIMVFPHGPDCTYRVKKPDTDGLDKNIQRYLETLFYVCPNHLFVDNGFRLSGITAPLKLKNSCAKDHELTIFTKESAEFTGDRDRIEGLRHYILEKDTQAVVCGIPVWIECREFSDYSQTAGTTKPLTGHIDLIRFDGKSNRVEVWGYRPAGLEETIAARRIFLCAYMLAVRTGVPLSSFRCGYFNEENACMFNPDDSQETSELFG